MVYWVQFHLGAYAMKKMENFWFYYKKHLLIGLAVVLLLGYLAIQKAATPEPDYQIGLVQAVPCTQEQLEGWEARFAAAGEDRNGDGQVLVKIHTYFVDLADDSPNAGVQNGDTVSALDADLIGNKSGIFLLEDVDTFRRITNGILAESAVPFDSGLYLTLRSDADPAYTALADALS